MLVTVVEAKKEELKIELLLRTVYAEMVRIGYSFRRKSVQSAYSEPDLNS
jgi:hypothetical protein